MRSEALRRATPDVVVSTHALPAPGRLQGAGPHGAGLQSGARCAQGWKQGPGSSSLDTWTAEACSVCPAEGRRVAPASHTPPAPTPTPTSTPVPRPPPDTDFVDPLHHEQATGRPSVNLDGWMLSKAQVLSAFHRHAADADVAVVEGVMGLYDGRDGASEQGSTAQIAKWLGAPVALVLDCSAVARSVAATVKGYLEFDRKLRLGGLIFNKVGGAAHTQWLCDAVAAAGIGVAVLGGFPAEASVGVPERYLGLHLPGKPSAPPALLGRLAALVSTHLDLDALLALAATAEVPAPKPGKGAGAAPPPAKQEEEGGAEQQEGGSEKPAAAGGVRIAVARDAAFCFYYQE